MERLIEASGRVGTKMCERMERAMGECFHGGKQGMGCVSKQGAGFKFLKRVGISSKLDRQGQVRSYLSRNPTHQRNSPRTSPAV